MRKTLEKIGLLDQRPIPPAPGYHPQSNDLYEFDPEDSTRVDLDLTAGSFELPEQASQADTALLQIDILSSTIPRWRAADIELIRDDGKSERHSFDRRARGRRLLDVSSLLEESGADTERVGSLAAVRIVGHRAKWRPRAGLLLFNNQPIGRQRVLVLAPHPDDAEIAAYGLYRNSDSAVVTITGGDAGGENYSHVVSDQRALYALKGKLRTWDSLVVPMLGGVAPERIANLGYADGTLQEMAAEPQRSFKPVNPGEHGIADRRRSLGTLLLRDGAEATWESLVQDLVHTLRVFRPRVIATPHPLLDAHPDHRCTSLALFDAIEQEGTYDVELLLYANHPVYWQGWPFGPPTRPSSLQPWPRNPARVRGVRSFPLSIEDQVEKLFALEAMHDLRRSPPSITRNLEWGALGSLMEARDAFLRHRIGPFSYYRRAVRSRELFLVHPGEDAPLLRRRYVDAPQLW